MLLRLAVLLALLLILPGHSTSAQFQGAIHTQQVVHGLQIELAVSQQTYPRGALAPVTASVRNVSSRPIQLRRTCGYGYLWVESVSESGRAAYPPAIPIAPTPTCSRAAPTITLRSGQVKKRALVIWLRGSHLRVAVSVVTGTIVGAAITLHLTSGTPPAVTRSHSGPNGPVMIVPREQVHGPLYFAIYSHCDLGANIVDSVSPRSRTGWMTTTDRVVLPPPCQSNVYGFMSWRLVAGWVGQPAVTWDSTAG